jgi:hypothetical protein
MKKTFYVNATLLSKAEMLSTVAGEDISSGGGDLKTCIDCCSTAANSTCNYSNNYSQCVQNICNQCFALFSSSPNGCY